MATADSDNWKSIWDGKGASVLESPNPGLADLIREDGFDSGAGDHSIESWRAFSGEVYRQLGIAAGSRVMEVGCGCGAFLYPATEIGAAVFGVDYSHQLLAAARRAMPTGQFTQAQAAALPWTDGHFDAVLCHSVFQYFNSRDYAEQAVHEMLRVCAPGGGIAILDVNDAEREQDFLRIRSAGMGEQAYREKYAAYPHRFYAKDWFRQLLQEAGLEVEIRDQAIAGYRNSALRFNVFARRTAR